MHKNSVRGESGDERGRRECTNIIQCKYLGLLLLTGAWIIVLDTIVIFGVLHIIRKSNFVYKHLFFIVLSFFSVHIVDAHYSGKMCMCSALKPAHPKMLVYQSFYQTSIQVQELEVTCENNSKQLYASLQAH